MKLLILSLVIVYCMSITESTRTGKECAESADWKKYKSEYGLKFNSEEKDFKYCLQRDENMEKLAIIKKQRRGNSEDYGETSAMHLNHTSSFAFGLKIDHSEEKQRRISSYYYKPTIDPSRLPKQFNWVDLGFTSAVRSQGDCGSCYSFSACGAIEGQFFKCYNRVVSFSEQYLLDCSPKTGGCCGSDPATVADFASTNGLPLEAEYPYMLGNCSPEEYQQRPRPSDCYQPNQCPLTKSHQNFKIDIIEHIEPNNEDHLKSALYEVGPVMVVVNADTYFSTCKKEIFDGLYTNPVATNHAVLLVGYDETSWIIKNSWGSWWAKNGYMRLARNSRYREGTAGILTYSQVVRKSGCQSTADFLRNRG